MNVRSRTLTIAAGLMAGFWPNLALTPPETPPAAQPPKNRRLNRTTAADSVPVPKVALVFYLHSYLGNSLDYGTARTAGTKVYVFDLQQFR